MSCEHNARFRIHVNPPTSEATLVEAWKGLGEFCKRCGKAEIRKLIGSTVITTGFGSPMHIPPIWTKE